MGKTFNIGDEVSFLFEKRQGQIIDVVDKAHVKVRDEDGFLVIVAKNEICLIHSNDYSYDDIHSQRIGIPEENKKVSLKSGKRKEEHIWEVDLHAHEIIDTTAGMSNGEILRLQVESCRQTIQKARQKYVRTVVLIHGVGKGVLRDEILELLRRMDNVSFQDADPKEYGIGATEVRLHY